MTRIIAALVWPVTAALAWLYARYDAKRDAARQAALEAAEQRNRTMEAMHDKVDTLPDDPDSLRKWLAERGQ
jgi:hypothetical protein